MDQATRGILKVARSVLEQLDIELVLKRVLDEARHLTGACYAALGVLDDSRSELSRFLTLGIDEHTRRLIGPLPTGRGVLGESIRSPRALRISDVGSHRYSYGFPVGHPPMSSFLGVPILVGGEPYGNLYLTEKQGASEFSEDDEQAAVLLADFAGVAIDHAGRFSASETQRHQLQQTVHALDATIQITRALGGETDLDAILELVAKRGRALVSARMLIIEFLRGDELELAAGAGELPAGLLGQRVALADTVAGAALRAGHTQRLTDRLMRARFDQHGLGHLGLSADDGLVVPLVFRNRPYGVLVALDHLRPGGFNAEHQRLLESFAASAATAVATAKSAADERYRQRVAAAEAERGRWARELHDETLQGLGSLRLLLAAAQRTARPDAIAAASRQAIIQLDSDIENLRTLISDLRPAALDQLGVGAAVQALAGRLSRDGPDIDVNIDLAYEQGRVTERHTPEFETAMYRIIQEALTNATKHGRAGRAVVEVTEEHDRVRITVRDDGVGFDPDARTEGFGLLGMRERAELLGGEIAVQSTAGQGTVVSVSLPVKRRQAADQRSSAPQAADLSAELRGGAGIRESVAATDADR
jgi:signal transduction histidine kinase